MLVRLAGQGGGCRERGLGFGNERVSDLRCWRTQACVVLPTCTGLCIRISRFVVLWKLFSDAASNVSLCLESWGRRVSSRSALL